MSSRVPDEEIREMEAEANAELEFSPAADRLSDEEQTAVVIGDQVLEAMRSFINGTPTTASILFHVNLEDRTFDVLVSPKT